MVKINVLFDHIATKYDFINDFLSFGTHRLWKKKLVKSIKTETSIPKFLDVASGTGDIAQMIHHRFKQSDIHGIDVSSEMINQAKVRDKDNLIQFSTYNGVKTDFADNIFDGISISFGIRNFEFPEKTMTELNRVKKDGASFYILEFGAPKTFFTKYIFFPLFKLVTLILDLFVKKNDAYKYLMKSSFSFPSGDDFKEFLIKECKLEISEFKYESVSGGICYLYEFK